ncbi:MAG: DUF4093 domain-containing protein [Clostridiales bacterium]|nr:DUF4093 domain-containing protein [Clostridiales bacterium]
MIKIKEAVIVEGKYDKIRLESVLSALIIPTNGFGIFKDREKMQMLRLLAKKRGLLILTDSDSAGFLIRNHLSGCIPKEQLRHAYIPDLYGKERRKDKPSKEGKLGVEGMPQQALLEALRRAGVTAEQDGETAEEERCPITKADLYADGLTGGAQSRLLRGKLLKELGLPERMTTNSLLEVMNSLMTREEYREKIDEIKKTL